MSEDRTDPAPYRESAAATKARRSRSIAMAFGLIAFVVLVFVVTLLKLSRHAA